MDGSRFDEVVRQLGRLTSRRRVLAGFGAALIGGGMAWPGGAFAAAAPAREAKGCLENGKPCRKPSECCSQRCASRGKRGRKVCKPCAVTRCGAGANVCAGPVCSCNGDESCGCWQRVGGGAACASITQGACVECEADSVCARLFGIPGSRCILTEGRNCTCPYGLKTGCVAPCGNACAPDGLACETAADCCSGVCGCRRGLCFCRHETCKPEKSPCNVGNYDLDCCEGKCDPVGDGPAGKCATRRLGR